MRVLNDSVRELFPLINGKDIAYLDNGATTQKPESVLNAMDDYYRAHNANPLRGIYELSTEATDIYEAARTAVAGFIGATGPEEIIFTRNSTESINLAAYSYGRSAVCEGDEIIVSVSEHHSNMLPWKMVAEEKGAKIVYLDCEENGSYDMDKLRNLVGPKTKIVAIAQVSNVIGRINDIKEITRIAHEAGAAVLVDGAQSVAHIKVDVKDLGVDFFAFSGHKMYAPMGIGVLYGRKELLEKMPPFLYGGEMIASVTKERTIYAELPHKFEAGTVEAGAAAGLKAAIDFINEYGFEQIVARENALSSIAVEGMKELPYIDILGSSRACHHHGIVAFRVQGVHPHDVAQIFADEGICVRAGHHCAEPLHRHLAELSGVKTTPSTRLSVALYNTEEEIRRFLDVLATVRGRMGITD